MSSTMKGGRRHHKRSAHKKSHKKHTRRHRTRRHRGGKVDWITSEHTPYALGGSRHHKRHHKRSAHKKSHKKRSRRQRGGTDYLSNPTLDKSTHPSWGMA